MEFESVVGEFTIATTVNDAFDDLVKMDGAREESVAKPQEQAEPQTSNNTNDAPDVKRKPEDSAESTRRKSARAGPSVSKKRASLSFSQHQTAQSALPNQQSDPSQHTRQPLFRPASQTPVPEVIRASGLGIENMDDQEILDMMQMDEGELDGDDAEGMEVQPVFQEEREVEVPESPVRFADDEETLNGVDETTALPATAVGSGEEGGGRRVSAVRRCLSSHRLYNVLINLTCSSFPYSMIDRLAKEAHTRQHDLVNVMSRPRPDNVILIHEEPSMACIIMIQK